MLCNLLKLIIIVLKSLAPLAYVLTSTHKTNKKYQKTTSYLKFN